MQSKLNDTYLWVGYERYFSEMYISLSLVTKIPKENSELIWYWYITGKKIACVCNWQSPAYVLCYTIYLILLSFLGGGREKSPGTLGVVVISVSITLAVQWQRALCCRERMTSFPALWRGLLSEVSWQLRVLPVQNGESSPRVFLHSDWRGFLRWHKSGTHLVTNQHARTEHQSSPKSASARNRPSTSSFNREGERTLENFPQVTGWENLVLLFVHRKCNWRLSFISKVDKNSLSRHNDKTSHSTGESPRSDTTAVIIGTLHPIYEDCTIPKDMFPALMLLQMAFQ